MKSIADILASQSLKPILDKRDELTRLNDAWKGILDQDWAQFCRIVNVDQGKLVLAVNNGIYATRIKYALPEITQMLRKHPAFSFLTEIKCKVIF